MSNSQSPKPNSAQFEADPLLKPGTFIDPTPTGPTTTVDPPESRPPVQNKATESAEGTPKSGSARKRAPEPTDWLPNGWKVESKERTSGATAGMVDKYYFELATGRRFRSKKEVMNYLQTGDVPSKRKKDNSDAKKSESSETKKKTSVQNFDFSNAPEDVTWTLRDDSTDTWTAVLGDKEVPESTRQEWAEAKDHVFATDSQNLV